MPAEAVPIAREATPIEIGSHIGMGCTYRIDGKRFGDAYGFMGGTHLHTCRRSGIDKPMAHLGASADPQYYELGGAGKGVERGGELIFGICWWVFS